jgi:hypothetical protein
VTISISIALLTTSGGDMRVFISSQIPFQRLNILWEIVFLTNSTKTQKRIPQAKVKRWTVRTGKVTKRTSTQMQCAYNIKTWKISISERVGRISIQTNATRKHNVRSHTTAIKCLEVWALYSTGYNFMLNTTSIQIKELISLS